MLLEGVKVISVSPVMYNIKTVTNLNHPENIELRYEKITWKYCDGNMIFADARNEGATA